MSCLSGEKNKPQENALLFLGGLVLMTVKAKTCNELIASTDCMQCSVKQKFSGHTL